MVGFENFLTSAIISQQASVANEPPATSMTWVGLHSVTSTPYALCHRASNGKAVTPPMAKNAIRMADMGMRIAPLFLAGPMLSICWKKNFQPPFLSLRPNANSVKQIIR
jgi:hypothetical protein